ncbi:MAG: sugar phosphate isomerase/epimerase [Planctomycetota bacterium]|nr:MAG: sugar phosphate isomerase/epimerase [Planctomycetota bacterium]
MRREKTRRQFLKLVGAGTAASLAGVSGCSRTHGQHSHQSEPGSKRLFHLGLASYTFRKFSLDQTLTMTRRLGLKYIALKSFHLPLESTKAEIKTVAAKVKSAELKLYGGGVIYMNSDAEVHRAFDYAKAAGMQVIIGVPKPQLLELVSKKVAQYDIKVAIHNHGPGDMVYPTPQSAYDRIKDLDKRVGLCIDVGHTQRAGVDPSESAQKHADRLLDVHIRDVSEAAAQGTTVEIGRGVIDIPRFIRTLQNIRYTGILSFEFEKDEPDPLPGLAESVGYIRGVLAAV